MNPIGTLALAALGAHEVWRGHERTIQANGALSAAKVRSKALQRPMLVLSRDKIERYGCSDECIDQNGCPACTVRLVASDLASLKPSSHVVVETCVLELLDEPFGTLATLLSIAGEAANYFATRTQAGTFASLHPANKWVYDPAIGTFRLVDGDRIVRSTFLGISVISILQG